MATLERPRDSTVGTHEPPSYADPAQSAVPTPFPAHAVPQTSPATNANRTDSRSPSSTRRQSLQRGMSGFVVKIKRTVSASRERGSGGSVTTTERDTSRGRRGSVDTGFTDETRGRTGMKTMDDDLSLVQQSTNRTATGTSVGGPLEQVTSRSTSRGRPMLSTGRGGAGNMREVAEANEQEWTGDEPAEVVQNARDAVERERSESRERTGREEWVTSGRGGQGNIRSRSRGRELDLGRVPTVQEAAERDEVAAQEQRDREVMERHIRNQQANKVYSTGRGGAGNIRNG